MMSIQSPPVEPVAEPEPAERSRSRRSVLLVATLGVLIALVVGAVVVAQIRRNADADAQLATRQAEVAQRGAHVMPFDQNLTAHQFAKDDTGGVETVRANDTRDAAQIALIQEHLQHERDLFATGDFSDPMAIHGHDMPGVQDLQRGATSGQLVVTYEALADGARLTYRAKSPALVDAVHVWFDAQLMDHGAHATN